MEHTLARVLFVYMPTHTMDVIDKSLLCRVPGFYLFTGADDSMNYVYMSFSTISTTFGTVMMISTGMLIFLWSSIVEYEGLRLFIVPGESKLNINNENLCECIDSG